MSLQDDIILPNSDSFWEVDSFKTTVKRAEDGLQMCNEIMKLIQERADIEKEYAKRLKAWAKKWNDSFEKGVLPLVLFKTIFSITQTCGSSYFYLVFILFLSQVRKSKFFS